MKKLFLALALFSAIAPLSAQNVQDNDYTFTYKRLPLKPLDKSIRNYKTVVVLESEAAYKQAMADYQKDMQLAEKEHQAALIQWEKDKKAAEAKYQEELKAWESKSTAQKIIDKKILEEGKPVLHLPYEPSKRYVSEPQKPAVSDPNALGNTYIKLDGYTRGEDKPVVIYVTVKEYEKLGPELKTSSATVVRDGKTSTVTEYYYSYSHKYPVVVEVKDPNGVTLMTKSIDKTDEYVEIKTKSYGSQSDLNKNWNPSTMPTKLEEQLLLANLKLANDEVNSQFGFSPIERKIKIYTVKASKFQYPEFDKAYESSLLAYSKMNQDGSEEAMKQALQAAIDQWEAALKESNPSDKKARIDNDVTVAARLNLAEAYIWMDEFDKAEGQLVKLMTIKTSKKEEKIMEELRALIKDERDRFNANRS